MTLTDQQQFTIVSEVQSFLADNNLPWDVALDWVCDRLDISATDEVIELVYSACDDDFCS